MSYIKKIIKNFLNQNNYYNIQDYNNKFGSFIKNYFYLILNVYIKNKTSFNLIQVGANDGKVGDPLYLFIKDNKKKINAVFFEPQIVPFKKLINRYSDNKNFYFVNKAVGIEGQFPFYSLNKRFQKDFGGLIKKNSFLGISSFYIDNLISRFKKYKNFDYKKHISVETLQVHNILKEISINLKNKSQTFLKNIHLLQIDAEGYDDIIIYSCNLNILKPILINFEHKNLSRAKQQKLHKYLRSKNYDIFLYPGSDTLAVRKS